MLFMYGNGGIRKGHVVRDRQATFSDGLSYACSMRRGERAAPLLASRQDQEDSKRQSFFLSILYYYHYPRGKVFFNFPLRSPHYFHCRCCHYFGGSDSETLRFLRQQRAGLANFRRQLLVFRKDMITRLP